MCFLPHRINPFNLNNDGKYYSIVEDNPFHKIDGKAEIIFSGLRNPWKFSLDDSQGLWIADVGQNCFEEINYIETLR